MANTTYNKIVINGITRIDLTSDTVTADKVLQGFTFHSKSGETGTGTCTYDSDTSEDTAAVAQILAGKTAHARGSLLTGTMPNRGGATGTITTKAGTYTIPQGYHDGSGSVSIAATEQAKIIPDNIRSGVTILGIEGAMSGTEDVNAQARTVTPTFSAQTILPETGFNYLSQVTVNAIAVTETDNSAGGITLTIG